MIAQPRLHPRSIAELLDASFRLYRNSFLTFLTIAALVLVPYNLLRFLIATPSELNPAQAGGLAYAISIFSDPFSTDETQLLGFMFGLLVEPIFYATCLLVAAQRYQQQPTSINDSFKTAVEHILLLIGSMIVSILAILLAALPALVFACFAAEAYSSIQIQQILGSFGGNSAPSNPSYILPIGLGGVALLFSIPAIVVGARLIFAAHAVVLEEAGAVESVQRSWALTRDYIWRAAGFSMIVGLLHVCLSMLPAGAITFGLLQLDLDQQIFSGLRLASVTIFEIIAAPFNIIAFTLMFLDLRFRNEALDLVENDLFSFDDSDGRPASSLGVSPQ